MQGLLLLRLYAWLTTISLALCKAFDLLEMFKKQEEMLSAMKELQLEMYLETHKHGEYLPTDPQKALPSFFITLNAWSLPLVTYMMNTSMATMDLFNDALKVFDEMNVRKLVG